MCGIAGFCNFKGDWQKNIGRMCDKMYHRGPDASGVWSSEDHRVVLGHRRLAIVDLSPAGAQPMVSHDGRYVIAYNGEIYNHTSIRKKLVAEGKAAAFRGTSDTETLLEAIAAYGLRDTLKMAKGMFAIALFDREERALFLARDRVGEKPLFYGILKNDLNNAGNERSFVFASDLGSIAALDGFTNSVNADIMGDYMRYGYIPAPYTVYRGIWKLEPGKILKIKAPFDKPEIESYWSMTETAVIGQKNRFRGSETEAAEELERLLRESIAGQMVADVPVGAFLSAGIDSSTVVSLMQEQSARKVRTFTVGMWEEQYNEAPVAKEIAAHLGTEHTEVYITEEDAKRVIPMLSGMFGEPFADSSQIPTYLVSKITREHVTVSLSGDGGDELFCGYNTYYSIDRIWNKERKVPGVLRRPASAVLGLAAASGKASLATRARLLGAKSIEDMYLRSEIGEGLKLITSGMADSAPDFGCWDAIQTRRAGQTWMDTYPSGLLEEGQHNLMLMDLLMYHPDDILNKVDRTAMAVSLETRVPMLDKDVVEFAWTLPLSYRQSGGVSKKILRDILYRYVPQELMERPKKGFSIPLHLWLKQKELREWAESLLSPSLLAEQGLFDAAAVKKLWDDYIMKNVWRPQIWYILVFQEWWTERKVESRFD
ncbi:MAG: asparagine synthase (glutamine-hydrolyzing) [Lachnospiraceae bacterium]|nr:asparagine synthase (glutamine-hydrolyzing) [Lachnospiraceae bacterium]